MTNPSIPTVSTDSSESVLEVLVNENQNTPPAPNVQPETSPSVSASASQGLNDKALLSEARATRDVLVGFRSAVEAGTFHGSKMMDLAKGLAFLQAILQQNNAHIHAIQERIDGSH